MAKVIEVQNLSLTYHSKLGETLALNNISFDIEHGEFISIVGPSGCGKTTILSILAGLLNPSNGDVLVNDEIPKTKIHSADICSNVIIFCLGEQLKKMYY